MVDKKVIAIIPARGGSKGIPLKNLQQINGESLIARIIRIAQDVKVIGRIVVSTDHKEIAQEARRSGAEVIMRPASLSADLSSSEDALLHVLDELSKKQAYQPDVLVFLQCTAPLTEAEDIEKALTIFENENADSVFTVAPFHDYIWSIDEKGKPRGINHDETKRLMRQERTPQYVETGSVYVLDVKGFIKTRYRFFGNISMNIVLPDRFLDINEPVDIAIANTVLLQRRKKTCDFSALKGVAFDFDGVFTDNKVCTNKKGEEVVSCCRSDGVGLSMLEDAGIKTVVISSEINGIVVRRCQKLGIPCFHGIKDKVSTVRVWAEQQGLALDSIAFVGNDINDLDVLGIVGFPVAVGDAYSRVKDVAAVVLSRAGGHGAVREIAEMIIKNNEG